MPPIGAHEGQKAHGTFQEHFTILQDLLTKAIEQGGASPEEYQGTILQLLKAVEALRLKNEAALLELEKQKAYHTAAVNVCSMMSNLVIHIVDARTRERLRILEGYKIIAQRELAEDKAHLEELKAAGSAEEAAELDISIRKREAEFKADEALGIGSVKEMEITKKAVQETAGILGGIMQRPPPNARAQESRAMEEVVGESLREVPVNEKVVVANEEKRRSSRKPKGKGSKEQP